LKRAARPAQKKLQQNVLKTRLFLLIVSLMPLCCLIPQKKPFSQFKRRICCLSSASLAREAVWILYFIRYSPRFSNPRPVAVGGSPNRSERAYRKPQFKAFGLPAHRMNLRFGRPIEAPF